MSAEILAGYVRTVLAYGAGYLASSGFIPEKGLNELVGALAMLAVAAWSHYAKRRKA